MLDVGFRLVWVRNDGLWQLHRVQKLDANDDVPTQILLDIPTANI